MIDHDQNEKAAHELRKVLTSTAADAEKLLGLGRFQAKNKLANGYTVTIEIKQGKTG